MSRSFVRTWATVATIMAVACFVFVLPMPDMVPLNGWAPPSPASFAVAKATQNPGGPGAQVAKDDEISASAGFVDSTVTGKSFNQVLFMPPSQELVHDTSFQLIVVSGLTDEKSANPDPLSRPG